MRMGYVSNYQRDCKYNNIYCFDKLEAKDAIFSGNVKFSNLEESKENTVTMKEIINDLKILKKENEEMKEIINILWNAPPSGGPGYQEALQNWEMNKK